MKSLRKFSKAISILLLLLLLITFGTAAQKGTSIVTRIRFARGRTTAVERGSVHRGVSHDYLLKAGAGQTMSVHLAARGGVCFDLYTPACRHAGAMREELVGRTAEVG